MTYESYEIVKHDGDTFGNLNGCGVVDDPAFIDDGDRPNPKYYVFPFQLVGERESMANVPNWYEVIAGFHTEDQAKRYVDALERADLLKAQINKSLESTLETIQKEDNQ